MANQKFNCSVACNGIYFDIQWEEEIALLKDGLSQTKGVNSLHRKKGDIIDRENFAKMIKEYANFKKQYVRHFRYDSNAESTNFGEITTSLVFCIDQ